jgi:3-hydroxyacyl-CoA dehydrogenase
MFVFKAAVVGAGTMGGEIAQVIAAADVPVVLKDVDQRFVDAGLDKARQVTEATVEKGKLTPEQAEALLGRIHPALDYDGFGDVDFVIEAVPERMEVKQTVFADLDAATPGHAILASNTSGLSISEIAYATERPDQVVGFHFFWPASRMRLVEIVEGDETSPETMQAAATFAQAIRKTAIRCGECPGFVVNRILGSLASEMWRYQDETGVGVEAIDEFVQANELAPMGPFRLSDMTGLDTTLKVARDLQDAYGERFHVHAEMERLVAEGHLGRKTGRGFYEYGS